MKQSRACFPPAILQGLNDAMMVLNTLRQKQIEYLSTGQPYRTIRSLRLFVWPAGHTPHTDRPSARQAPLFASWPRLGRAKLLSTPVLIRAFERYRTGLNSFWRKLSPQENTASIRSSLEFSLGSHPTIDFINSLQAYVY